MVFFSKVPGDKFEVGVGQSESSQVLLGYFEGDGFLRLAASSRGVKIEPADLDILLRKAEEIARFGANLPNCPGCGSTPFFQRVVGVVGVDIKETLCQDQFHIRALLVASR
jgi:hypothetical protein